MRPDDVPVAFAVAHTALEEGGRRFGGAAVHELDDATRARGVARHARLQGTDPEGSWVAEAAGEVVGVAFALVREQLWFLSLLAVAAHVQAQGVGGRLLEAALQTAEGVPTGLIMSTSDPKALRRYGRAGFALLPGYDLSGAVDRALLPAVPGVREGDWDTDRDQVDDLGRRLRGAAYGPDLDASKETGARLLVADDGFAVLDRGRLKVLGAGDPGTAQALLWAALAETTDDVEVWAVTGAQQWALEVALQARLTIRPGSSLCTRGPLGPMTPYLPSGTYG
jgi:predicted N-acetyltransferase YhbS